MSIILCTILVVFLSIYLRNTFAYILGFKSRMPKFIPITVYKYALDSLNGGFVIVTLRVPAMTLRHQSWFDDKCRTSRARVISIEDRYGKPVDKAVSSFDYSYEYTI